MARWATKKTNSASQEPQHFAVQARRGGNDAVAQGLPLVEEVPLARTVGNTGAGLPAEKDPGGNVPFVAGFGREVGVALASRKQRELVGGRAHGYDLHPVPEGVELTTADFISACQDPRSLDVFPLRGPEALAHTPRTLATKRGKEILFCRVVEDSEHGLVVRDQGYGQGKLGHAVDVLAGTVDGIHDPNPGAGQAVRVVGRLFAQPAAAGQEGGELLPEDRIGGQVGLRDRILGPLAAPYRLAFRVLVPDPLGLSEQLHHRQRSFSRHPNGGVEEAFWRHGKGEAHGRTAYLHAMLRSMYTSVLVVAACAQELQAWRQRFGYPAPSRGRTLELGPGLQVLLTGVGPSAAQKAAETLVAARPDIVLHVGFAGGLRPGLSAGDLVLVTGVSPTIVDLGPAASDRPALPEPIEVATAPLPLLRTRLAQLPRRFAQGPLLTVSRFADRSQQKLSLGQDSPYLACEMEAAPLREAAQRCGAQYVGLRAISDPADEDVVPSLRSTGGVRGLAPKRILRWLARPKAALDVVRMVKGGRRARAALGEGIEAALEALSHYTNAREAESGPTS